jgi:hypothetical protein
MAQLHSPVGEHLSEEQSPVALLRLPLAAQERDPMITATAQETRYRRLKRRCLCHAAVESATLFVVILISRRPTAKLVSEE